MQYYLTPQSTLEALGDKIRQLAGITGELTVETAVQELQTQSDNIAEIKQALRDNGIDVDDNANLSDLIDIVGSASSTQGGIDTSDATATAADIRKDKTAYVDGEKVTGSMATITSMRPYAAVTSLTDTDIGYEVSITMQANGYVYNPVANIVIAKDALGNATTDKVLSGATFTSENGLKIEGTIATKTSSNLTASGATVTVPAGYYASNASKSVATAAQATPSISVNSSGLVTASATQTAGYVAAGTKNATKQLTTQAAKTITPTKSSQTAVAKDVYTTGAITVDAIPSNYIVTSDATALAGDILEGESAYVDGKKVIGTFTIDDELQTQDSLIAQIQTALSGKAAGSEPELQEKTVTPTTSSQSITPDSGYDGLSKVTVNAMPTATQATPSISISSSGLITVSATQTAGYVAAGTKSGTKQLTTQSAKTITPSTSSQTAVASGVYTTGAVTVAAIPSTYVKPTTTKSATTYTPSTSNQTIASGTYCSGTQTIKGDANLVAGNIKSGVSIFGVSGNYSGSGSGGGSGSTGGTCTVTMNLPAGVCVFGWEPMM